MSRLGKSIVVVAVVWCVMSIAYFSHRGGRLGLLLLLLLGLPLGAGFLAAIIASFFCLFREWRQKRWLSVLPLAACILAIVICRAYGQKIRQTIFARALPSYEAAVRQMKSGDIPVPTDLARIPQTESLTRLAYAVLAQKDTNGVLTVEFLTEAGFPLKHSGYLYSGSGVIQPGSSADARWPIRTELQPHWFYISD